MVASLDAFSEKKMPFIVGYGVDTLVLNVRYSDEAFAPVQKPLDDAFLHELNDLQASARQSETDLILFQGVLHML